MVDTDNTLFKANKLVQNGDSLPKSLFGELEQQLKKNKAHVDELDFRLDELGINCGSASKAYAFKQRIEKLNQKLVGAMDAI